MDVIEKDFRIFIEVKDVADSALLRVLMYFKLTALTLELQMKLNSLQGEV